MAATGFLAFAALASVAPPQLHDHTVSNADDTLSAYNMGDQVVFVFDPDPRAQAYYLEVARSRLGRWTRLEPFSRFALEHNAGLVDYPATSSVPGRFIPDLCSDVVYYRLKLADKAGNVFRTYPPVRVPPSVECH